MNDKKKSKKSRSEDAAIRPVDESLVATVAILKSFKAGLLSVTTAAAYIDCIKFTSFQLEESSRARG